jgi:hypothetical protein
VQRLALVIVRTDAQENTDAAGAYTVYLEAE